MMLVRRSRQGESCHVWRAATAIRESVAIWSDSPLRTNMRCRLKFLRLLLWLALAISAAPPLEAAGLNVLVVLSDDHSAAHLGCYGNHDVQTPAFDAFARTAVRFDRAYVTSPQCVPSRASIMTGRSPVAIGMTRFTATLPRDVPTWLDVLRTAGYHTGVAGRTYHLDGPWKSEVEPILVKHGLKTFPDRIDFLKQAKEGDQCLVQFREFLDSVPNDKPFALQLSFPEPHRPYDAPCVTDPQAITLPPQVPDTAAVRQDFAAYYDMIARLDGHFGKVLAELEGRKLADSTLVVFMGDNGASQWRGKGTLYELGIRVPLLVRWPGVSTPSAASDELISGEDIAPTILQACGHEPLPAMTGRSFAAILRGDRHTGRTYVFAERGAHGQALPGSSANFDLGRAVVSPTHKLVYNATFHLPYEPVDFAGTEVFKEVRRLAVERKLPLPLSVLYDGRRRDMIEVFDLGADPAELVNLAGRPEVADAEHELRTALVEWMILERDYLPLPLKQ